MRVAKHVLSLAGDSVVYGISGTVVKFVGLFLIPVYTRVFAPEEYGIIALVDVLVSLVGLFVVLGLDNAAARWFYDSDDTHDRKATISSWYWCQLTVAVTLSALLAVYAVPLSSLVLGSREYAAVLVLGLLSVPIATSSRVLDSWFRFQRRPWAAISVSTTTMLCNVGLVVLFVVGWRKGIPGMYVARLIAAVLAAVCATVILGRWIRIGAFSPSRLRSMLLYGLPLVPASMAAWVMISANRLILQAYCSTEEVGLYAVATTIASGVAMIVNAFAQAWGPFAFSILREPDCQRVYARVLDLFAFLGCGLCAAAALFGPWLLRLLTTKAYYAAAPCISYLSFAFLFSGAYYIAGLGASIAKTSLPHSIAIILGAVTNVALCCLLIPLLAREGAALAMMCAYGVTTFYLFRASQKLYPIPYQWNMALFCLVFAWIEVLVDRWLIPSAGFTGFVLRLGLLSAWPPLGYCFRLYRWHHVQQLRRYVMELRTATFRSS